MNVKRPQLTALALWALAVGGVIVFRWSGGGSPPPEGRGAGAEAFSSRPVSVRKLPSFKTAPDVEELELAADIQALRALVLHDPERACQEALKLGSAAVASLSAAWVEWDADAAVRWVLSLQGSLREAGLATLAVELVSEDPQYALKLALAMETGVTRNETAAFVMTQWAAGNPGEMLQWTSELNDAGLRMAAEQRLLPAIASRDPVLAATYVAEQIDQPGLQMAVVPAILQRWAQRDPVAAAAWVAGIPDAELRTQGLDAMLRVWAQQNAGTLYQWWLREPAGSFRDEAAVAMAGILADTDRSIARLYAEGITDEALRTSALTRVSTP